MDYPSIRQLKNIQDKFVLVRLDLNVPTQDGKVVEDYRIKKSLPTLHYLQEQGAKIVIISHIEGGSDTLRPVFEYLKNSLPITFCQDCLEEGNHYRENMKAGEILLCENVRLYDGEKKNDEEFARKLALLGDFFVNDAFSVSHRKHASVVGVTKFLPSCIGFQFEEEIANLASCFSPEHPFVFILGGAKFDTKLPLVQKFLPIADTLFIGGALANDLYKAQGMSVGKSLVSDSATDLSAIATNSKVMLPDSVVISMTDGSSETVPITAIPAEGYAADAAPGGLKQLAENINGSKHILWNGPLGNYEKGFKEGTFELARMIAAATANGAKTIIGGGDTLAAISELKLDASFTFISTGGGAMLDYLASGTLPGLDALKKK